MSTTTTGGRNDQEPVVVWEAANPMEAEIVKGRLESEGIPAIVRAEAASAIFGLTTGGLARAEVLVPAALADKAFELLSSEDGEEVAESGDGMAESGDGMAESGDGAAESGAADA